MACDARPHDRTINGASGIALAQAGLSRNPAGFASATRLSSASHLQRRHGDVKGFEPRTGLILSCFVTIRVRD